MSTAGTGEGLRFEDFRKFATGLLICTRRGLVVRVMLFDWSWGYVIHPGGGGDHLAGAHWGEWDVYDAIEAADEALRALAMKEA
jgi:hypothetical protein